MESASPKKLSVVMPVYNEEATLETVIERVEKAPACGLQKQIILVDDGSTDRSREILERYRHKHTVVFQPRNRGKGAALRTGFEHAEGDVVIVQDADMEYDPADFPRLLQPIVDGYADVVYGSRFLTGDVHRVLFFWHSVGNRMLTTLSNMFTNLNLTDMEVCHKAFGTSILRSITLEQDRFGFEPEVTAKIARLRGIRVYEVGISYHGRSYEEGKKIGWKDAVQALWCILRYH